MKDHIEVREGVTTFSGRGAVDVYRALVIASGLELYAKTGMKPNRAYTPSAMMKAAREFTGKTLKARDYVGAAKALREWADSQAVPVVRT